MRGFARIHPQLVKSPHWARTPHHPHTTPNMSTKQLLEEAQKLGLPQGESLYHRVIDVNVTDATGSQKERAAQDQEVAFLALGSYYAQSTQDLDKLAQLVTKSCEVTQHYAKSKTSKIIRALIDDMAQIPNSTQKQIDVINKCIDWAVASQRGFLRQGLQIRLIGLLYDSQQYHDAVELAGSLLLELKRLDDKMMLVEVQLHQARIYHALRNIPKARAALTSARTSANSVYTPTLMQAQLDMMSGVLQAEEGDYKTAFSYFYEAFEGYSSLDNKNTVQALKYLLLVKIMLNLSSDVEQLLKNKTIAKYQGKSIEAMTAMSKANADRSLKDFGQVLQKYDAELTTDPFIRAHFTALYEKLFQENLMKVIEPYSCVEVEHLATLLGLSATLIEGKISQMILDGVFNGVLDQSKGWLYVYPEPEADKTYEMSLETVKQMSTVVDTLYEKAAIIN